ncbi:MAG: ankyrin repeat domain-containing protein [Planctomycetota bacterium]
MQIHEYASQGNRDGVLEELQKGVPVDSLSDGDYTALACASRSSQAGVEVLDLLIEAGADVNCAVDEQKHFPLELAAGSGDLSKVQRLLSAGARIKQACSKGYTALINIMYQLHDDKSLVPMIELLLKHGGETDHLTAYGESPLSIASRLGRLDAVKCLLDAGADPSPLLWTPLMKVVALGTVEEMPPLLSGTTTLDATDSFSRTAFHLAALVGDVRKARLLHEHGAKIDQPDNSGETALMIAAARGNTEMLRWLIIHGADLEATNGMDFTALMIAAGDGQTESVQVLLEAGADPMHRNQFRSSAISMAANESVIRLLMNSGQDLADISTKMKRMLIGLQDKESINVSESEYRSGKDRRYGRSNPEVMNIPFWQAMVRSGCNAYQPRKQFNDMNQSAGPLWCFDRFGMSFTALPDGRFVQIGGEHEDCYDPDFCIYNEVVVHDRSGTFQIMGYPENLFPPTDFHSSTFVNGIIYIIGRLGYHGTREFAVTPVYRLNCHTWKIEPVQTSGANPGWIYEHKTSFDGATSLVVSGGKICKEVDGEEQHVENEDRYSLDLADMKWTRISCGNGLQEPSTSDE